MTRNIKWNRIIIAVAILLLLIGSVTAVVVAQSGGETETFNSKKSESGETITYEVSAEPGSGELNKGDVISITVTEVTTEYRNSEDHTLVTKKDITEEVSAEEVSIEYNEDLFTAEGTTLTYIAETTESSTGEVKVSYKDTSISAAYDCLATVEEVQTATEEETTSDSISASTTVGSTSTAIDILINKTHPLSSSYVPPDLVNVLDYGLPCTHGADSSVNDLRLPAAEALKSMFDAASAQGYTLYCASGYRSYALQESIFESNVSTYGEDYANTFSARPGQSEHQTGLAMDITSESAGFALSSSFGSTAEGIWVAQNAHKYGFIIRYPAGAESITGYQYEPWHLRYLGVDLATAVYNSGLTYEEYLGF
jgi:D-alanyl-D-alanine carboxypeptidase